MIPFRIDDLGGIGVGSYQFDLIYDPSVITPADAAASIAGTMDESLTGVSNSPTPGLLKVVVYGAVPVYGDGVYVYLRFKVTGNAGSATPLQTKRLQTKRRHRRHRPKRRPPDHRTVRRVRSAMRVGTTCGSGWLKTTFDDLNPSGGTYNAEPANHTECSKVQGSVPTDRHRSTRT